MLLSKSPHFNENEVHLKGNTYDKLLEYIKAWKMAGIFKPTFRDAFLLERKGFLFFFIKVSS